MQKQNSLFQPVQQKLKEAVKQAADAKKIDFVISGESVLYGGVDLTSDVQSIMKK
jgi:Skp family chaperone for outer membrane proteins